MGEAGGRGGDPADNGSETAGGSGEPRVINLDQIQTLEDAEAAGLTIELSDGVGKNAGKSYFKVVLDKGTVFIQNGQKREARAGSVRSQATETEQPIIWGDKPLGSLHEDEALARGMAEIGECRQRLPELGDMVDLIISQGDFGKYKQDLIWLDLFGRLAPLADGRRKRTPRLHSDQNIAIFSLVAGKPGMTEDEARIYAAEQGMHEASDLDEKLYQWAQEGLREEPVPEVAGKTEPLSFDERAAAIRDGFPREEHEAIVAEFPPADQLGCRANVAEHDYLDVGVKGNLAAKVRKARDKAWHDLAQDIALYEGYRSDGVVVLSDSDLVGAYGGDPVLALRTSLKIKAKHILYNNSIIKQADDFLLMDGLEPEVKEKVKPILDFSGDDDAPEKIRMYQALGTALVPGLRSQDVEEAGRLFLMLRTGEMTQEEWDAKIQDWQESNHIRQSGENAAEDSDKERWDAMRKALAPYVISEIARYHSSKPITIPTLVMRFGPEELDTKNSPHVNATDTPVLPRFANAQVKDGKFVLITFDGKWNSYTQHEYHDSTETFESLDLLVAKVQELHKEGLELFGDQESETVDLRPPKDHEVLSSQKELRARLEFYESLIKAAETKDLEHYTPIFEQTRQDIINDLVDDARELYIDPDEMRQALEATDLREVRSFYEFQRHYFSPVQNADAPESNASENVATAEQPLYSLEDTLEGVQVCKHGKVLSSEELDAVLRDIESRMDKKNDEVYSQAVEEWSQIREIMSGWEEANPEAAYEFDTVATLTVRGRPVRLTRGGAVTVAEPGYFPISSTGYRSMDYGGGMAGFQKAFTTVEALEKQAVEQDKERKGVLKKFKKKLAGAQKNKDMVHRIIQLQFLVSGNLGQSMFCPDEERPLFLQNAKEASQALADLPDWQESFQLGGWSAENYEDARKGGIDLLPFLDRAMESGDLSEMLEKVVLKSRTLSMPGAYAYLKTKARAARALGQTEKVVQDALTEAGFTVLENPFVYVRTVEGADGATYRFNVRRLNGEGDGYDYRVTVSSRHGDIVVPSRDLGAGKSPEEALALVEAEVASRTEGDESSQDAPVDRNEGLDPVEAKAAEIWASMDDNERAGVKFGLFPANKMQPAEQEGIDGRELSVALMRLAKESSEKPAAKGAPEHINNEGKPLDPNNRFEPAAPGEAKSEAEIDEGLVPLTMDPAAFKVITDEWVALFENPEAKVITGHRTKGTDYITKEEAEARIDGWAEHALGQREKRHEFVGENAKSNQDKTILSLFDTTGKWSQPYVDAGYNVIRVDIQDGHDIMDFSAEYLFENFDFGDYQVYGVLAACPCTDFAVSGARHFAAKDADGRTEASKELVFQTMKTIELLRPKFWVLENPVGRIQKLTGIPEARMTFDPHHFGETYTKKTILYGQFNTDLPLANTEPVDGSIMHKKYGGKSIATKNARSATPEGFAYAFFMANNYMDDGPEQRLLWHYPEASGAIKQALEAGISEARIHELMDPTYGDYEYEEARNALIAEVAKKVGQKTEDSLAQEAEPAPEAVAGEPPVQAWRMTFAEWLEFLKAEYPDGMLPNGLRLADVDALRDEHKLAVSLSLTKKVVGGPHIPPMEVLEDYPDLKQKALELQQAKSGEKKVVAFPVKPKVLNPRHYFISDEITRDAGFSPKKRFEENVAAIRTLKQIEEEGREATDEEKAILVKYNGWGGLAQVFDRNATAGTDEMEAESRSDWVTVARDKIMPGLLTEEEYRSARESVNNAHFTPPETIKPIWDAVRRLGFKGGRVLEPSMGSGSFFGLADPSLVKKSAFVGVEKDDITGRIAQLVYPDADIRVTGFEETKLPDGFFDLVISNVPFGNFQVFDEKYDHHKLSIHDYFIVKALDKLKPGGIGAVITSNHTMDKIATKARRMMAARGDLVGAIRLPDNAQEAQAGARVTTDILFFRKKAKPGIGEDAAWVESESLEMQRSWLDYESKKEIPLNRYFVDNPKHMLGEWKLSRGQHGRDRAIVEGDGSFKEQLPEVVGRLFPAVAEDLDESEDRSLTVEDLEPPETPAGEIICDFGSRAEGTFILNEEDGKVYQVLEGGEKATPVALKGKPLARMVGMIGVRDAMDEVFRLQKQHPDDTPEVERILAASRSELNRVYDAFVAEYGPLNLSVNRRLFLDDPEFGRLMALEIFDEKEKQAEKADVFFQRVLVAPKPVESVSTAHEGLVVSLNFRGCVDMPYIAQLCGEPEEVVAQKLMDAGEVYCDPAGENWVTAAEYLSGNVRKKLSSAIAAAEIDAVFERNVKALQDVQPADLTPKDIDFRIGSPWIPVSVITDFMAETMGVSVHQRNLISVSYQSLNGRWSLDGPSVLKDGLKATGEFGTGRRPFLDLMDRLLNQQSMEVFDKLDDGGRVLNVQKTVEAQQKAGLLQQKFQEFLWADEDRTEKLLKIYNDRFNAYVPPVYDGSHLTFPGMSPTITMRPCQANAVWRGLQTGNMLCAHEVGVGKTMVQLALAMEMKRLGKSTKTQLIVPNHMLAQMEREARQLYPSARILAVSKKDMEKKNRKRFMGKVANNNWDLVIMTHSMFGKVAIPPEFEKLFIEDELIAYRTQLEGVNTESKDERRRNGVKNIETRIKNLETKLKRLGAANKADDGIYLDDMGIDALLVDESHNFKNLAVETGSRSEVSESINGSAKAWDLYLKTRWLFDQRNDVSGLCLSSATPVSNSVLEIYNVMRYAMPDLLEEAGLTSINAWAGTFLTPKTQWEPSPSGTGWKLRTRFALNNLPELMRMMRMVMDVVTAEDAGIKRPEPNRSNITAEMSEYQKRYMHYLDLRVKRMQGGGVDPSEDNILKIVSEGRQMALDPRLLMPGLPDFEGSKVNKCVDRMFARYQDTMDRRGTQLTFLDIGTPKKDRFSVYVDIREKLIAKGVPAEEIAFIHDYPKDEQKADLFAKVRSGEVRFLLGSTAKMGEGTNAQDLIAAINHLDAPWRPSDIEQRDGRGLRQGNKNAMIDIDIYTTEDSFDLFMWNTLKVKAETFSRVVRGDCTVRRLDLEVDPTYAETAAITSNDTLIKEKLEVEQEVGRLEMLQKGHADSIWRARYQLRNYQAEREDHLVSLEQYLAVPEPTGYVNEWEIDLEPYGFDSVFKGDREKLLPLLAKLMNSQKISSVDGLKCGGVPVRISRSFDASKDRRYTTWYVGEGENEISLNQASKVEDLLSYADVHIRSLRGKIDYCDKKIKEAAEAAERVFPEAEELQALYARQQEVLQRIKEASAKEEEGKAKGSFSLDEIQANLHNYILTGDPNGAFKDDLDIPEEEMASLVL